MYVIKLSEVRYQCIFRLNSEENDKIFMRNLKNSYVYRSVFYFAYKRNYAKFMNGN